jgi:signal transduction histidine kinase
LYPMYTTKEDGTGMGLSICLGIVENHGGTLTFDSRVGEGSVFTITFPKTSP